MRRLILTLVPASLLAVQCDLSQFHAQQGLAAQAIPDGVQLTWLGAPGQEVRVQLAVNAGAPVVRELAVRKSGGAWSILGRNLTPEFAVTAAKRRISNQQLEPLKKLGLTSAEFLEQEKWKVFWDAPLVIPGSTRVNPGLPRSQSEVRRGVSKFATTACSAKTDGARAEVTFDGLTLGVFSGKLQFTAYKGTNLLRQEAIAKTGEEAVAYNYRAGLKGMKVDDGPRIQWQDVARAWQKYEFGGAPNADPMAMRARNRLAVIETKSGSLAVFPSPHKFFWAREIEMNLGYVYYRKDDDASYSFGVRNNDREEMYRPFGVSDEVYQRRQGQSRGFATGNFALFNAPPGTWQRMAAYYYLSPEGRDATQKQVLAFTHDDRYKEMQGWKVAISHFHTAFNEYLADAGTIDAQPAWIPAFRALGVNIAMMSDFHGDGHAKDAGPLRFKDQKVYFDGCRRHSDKDFLLMPGEEPDAYFEGHYSMVFPRPVYWSQVRQAGQEFVENDPVYGKVYHIKDAADELEMLKRENGLVWQAHPRTKGSSGYPDAIRDTMHFLSDRYLGASFQSLPVDLSEQRLCEVRCLGTLDDMNNWAGPKYLFSEGDTYQKFPEDETYPHLMVNYVKLDRLPRYNEDWTPITRSMRAGDFFVTSGEVLLNSWAIEGSGAQRKFSVQFEWTYPLEFYELVWGDGKTTGRKVISATDLPPFGSQRVSIPFEATGKKWVRFAAWDSAGNGVIGQPIHIK
ncbi:MAG: hypothetical protein U0Q16_27515 [Bryobacteraceae bacterium]